jgi:cytoskeletal protein CcmA (bactofilin family)
MWKDRTSRIQVPSYVPPIASRTMTAVPAARVMNEDVPANLVASGPLAVRPERSGSVLGAALHIKGDISGSEDLLVDGGVEGLIRIEGRTLTVGPSARIVADVQAAGIIVYGNVQGNLCALDRIEIKKNGSVVGELATSRIMIEDGAYFKGSIEIDRRVGVSGDHLDRESRGVAVPVLAPVLMGARPRSIPLTSTSSSNPGK